MRLHQKLALRALVGSQSLHSDFGQHGSNLKNLDNNTLAGDTLLASPHVSKQIKSGNSGTIYTLADVAECVLPTLEDVPILYVPVNKRGGPLDQPDPEMWHVSWKNWPFSRETSLTSFKWQALNMNEWTKQLFNNCPAVRNTVCNDKGGDNGERCGFATSISTLLIGGIRRHKNAVDYAGFPVGRVLLFWCYWRFELRPLWSAMQINVIGENMQMRIEDTWLARMTGRPFLPMLMRTISWNTEDGTQW